MPFWNADQCGQRVSKGCELGGGGRITLDGRTESEQQANCESESPYVARVDVSTDGSAGLARRNRGGDTRLEGINARRVSEVDLVRKREREGSQPAELAEQRVGQEASKPPDEDVESVRARWRGLVQNREHRLGCVLDGRLEERLL